MCDNIVKCKIITVGEAYRSDDSPIPYIPYPVNPNTGRPVNTHLKALERRSDLKYGGAVSDEKTGLHVPICAVTIHPQV